MNTVTTTTSDVAAKPKRRYRTKAIKLQDELLAFETERGAFTAVRLVNLFARLVTTGLAWKLQGNYGRWAKWCIESGYIAPNGVVLKYPKEERRMKHASDCYGAVDASTGEYACHCLSPSRASFQFDRRNHVAKRRNRRDA